MAHGARKLHTPTRLASLLAPRECCSPFPSKAQARSSHLPARSNPPLHGAPRNKNPKDCEAVRVFGLPTHTEAPRRELFALFRRLFRRLVETPLVRSRQDWSTAQPIRFAGRLEGLQANSPTS